MGVRVLVLAIAAVVGARPAAAQDCAQPVPDSMSYHEHWTRPEDPSRIRSALLASLRDRGYRLARDSDTLVVRTEPHRGWPDDPAFDPLRSRVHPGVTLLIQLQRVSDSTRVDLFARALCAVPTDRPPPGQSPVERAAAAAAVLDLDGALVQRLPRLPPSPSESREVRARMISCPRPQVPAGPRGRVVVDAVIDTAGRVDPTSVRVITSFRPDLDSAAVLAVKECRFQPGRDLAGAPIWVRVQLPFDFGP